MLVILFFVFSSHVALWVVLWEKLLSIFLPVQH